MAEPLKNIYDESYIRRLAKELRRAGLKVSDKAMSSFVFDDEWEEKELKARTSHLCMALREFLPQDYTKACALLITAGESFNGYEGMFFPEFVSRFGAEDWQTSMDTLEVLTTYSSAEFAIRPFLEREPARTLERMKKWARHPNEHVRRLSSEGARPLLPWASRLEEFRKEPGALFEILDQLIEDESLYVRKSVANHLNDISKDHPKLALQKAKGWIKNKNPDTLWIVKHGLRTLLKSGEQSAMALFGYAKRGDFEVKDFQLPQKLVHMNEKLILPFSLEVKKKGEYRIEYCFFFKKKKGSYTQKVFKMSERALEKGSYDFLKEHHFKPIGTRKYYDGLHFVELIINGHRLGKKPFVLWHRESPYMVYMLLTKKGTIYTGMTTDINRRYEEHSSGKKGAKYTKANAPEKLLYLEAAKDRSDAQKKEAALKKLKRSEKEKISWLDLF